MSHAPEMIHAQAMAPWHAAEWFFFVLANLIIVYFCAPKLALDVRKWLKRSRAGG